MAKRLIRTFDGLSGAPAAGVYAMAIRAKGDFVFMMGQGGYDLDGKLAGRDAAVQAEQACANIRTLLEEVGGDVSDICKLTVYMTDLAFRRPVYAAIERSLAGATVCRTGMVVSSLGPPEMLVEIDAFAVIGS